jgi:hypothetical protein
MSPEGLVTRECQFFRLGFSAVRCRKLRLSEPMAGFFDWSVEPAADLESGSTCRSAITAHLCERAAATSYVHLSIIA